MIRKIDIPKGVGLSCYSKIPEYSTTVAELKEEAKQLTYSLQGRTVWMLNSTDRGGGVAEMLPKMIDIFRDLSISMEWVVLQAKEQSFFDFTKRIHNMIHASGKSGISKAEQKIYEKVNQENAASLAKHIKKNDILIVHDPQPMAIGAILKRSMGIPTIWRSHIGTDQDNQTTKSAWDFLEAYAPHYDFGVFTASEYIPPYFQDRAHIIQPAIDPSSPKNMALQPYPLIQILCNGNLEKTEHPALHADYPSPVQRLQKDGSFASAYLPQNFGLLYRPIITQISRWDRLKGFQPLIEAFVKLKQDAKNGKNQNKQRIQSLARLVLAGPDPSSIHDDPEGKEVLSELIAYYRSLLPVMQEDIALFTLPMDSLENNALLVNAIQRCSTVVVQNSLQEGFGLTITEAMWKGKALLSTQTVGPRQQIRHQENGHLISNPQDTNELSQALQNMLTQSEQREQYGENARAYVYQEFLIFSQIRKWLRLLAKLV